MRERKFLHGLGMVPAGLGADMNAVVQLAASATANGIRLRMEVHSVKHRWLAAKQGAVQSAVWGSAGLRFLHFLLGRRDRRG